MKKVLTVLLVIAVMFTFSFGTAFADVTDTDKATALGKAREEAVKIINNYQQAALTLLAKEDLGYDGDGLETDAEKEAFRSEAWAKIDIVGQLNSDIADKYVAEAEAGFPNYVEDVATYAAKVFGISTKDDNGDAVLVDENLKDAIVALMANEAVKNMYDADRESVLAALDNIDYAAYSSTEVNSDGITYLAEAQKKVADAKKEAASKNVYKLAEIGDIVQINELAGKLDEIKSWLEEIVTAENYEGTDIPNGMYLVNGVKTTDQLANESITGEASKASVKAAAQKYYADYVTGSNPDKAFAEAYLTIYNYLADAGVLTNSDDVEDIATLTASAADWKDAVKQIADLNTFAAKYKAEKDADGNLVRESAAVDKIVAKATKYLYAKTENPAYEDENEAYTTVDIAKAAIANLYTEKQTYDLNFAKEAAKAAVHAAYDDVIDDYYPLEAAKIESKLAEMLADIEAADTIAKVETAIGGTTAAEITAKLVGNVKTAEDVDNEINWNSGAAKSALDAVKAYIQYANTGKTVLDNDYIIENEDDIKDAIAAIYGEAGARTAAEQKAVSIDTSAIAAQLSTVGSLAAAKAAAEEAIAALPASISAADKDAVVAAYELAEAYNGMTGAGTLSNQTKLDNAITSLKTKMNNDFTIRTASVNKNDKAALKALLAEIEEANKMVGEDKMFAEPPFDTDKIQGYLDDIREKEKAAVIAAINAIPINVTEADKAVVEAARALYDAYVAEYTDYGTEYEDADNAANDITNYRELALAEATLGLNAGDPAYTVESLKIVKAHSTAGKGYIKVMWTVQGDTSAVEGYEIWKSTKRNSGYSKAYTKKGANATWYKNTKGLKKGTRYYYKVRAIAYTADGTKIKSDWSNKAYRIAK